MLPEMKPGDVVLFRGAALHSAAIRYLSRSPGEARPAVFNHVGVAIDAGRLVEALSHVVVSALDKRMHEAGEQIMIARRKGLTDAQRANIALDASRQVGRKYGWSKIGGHFGDYWLSRIRMKETYFFRRWTKSGKYPICSWVVGFAYAKAVGIWFNEIAPNFAQPDDMGDEVIERNPADWSVIYCHPALTASILAGAGKVA